MDSISTEAGPAVDRSLAVRQMMRPLRDYLADDAVREITIPRPGDIFLRKDGRWHHRQDDCLSLGYLEALCAAMASYNDNPFLPIMSLKLPDGERAQIARSPAVVDGTISINIRKHSSVVTTLERLSAAGAFDGWRDAGGRRQGAISDQDRELLALKDAGDIHSFLRRAVELRRNIIISGQTGSGKTTFARSLIEVVPTSERLITIEDVHELFLPNHPNRVHMLYGGPDSPVTAFDCLAACMRSSPDRIFLSELRGPEAWEYMQALNTGHPGTVTTTHANSALDTHDRVALLVKQSEVGRQLDLDTIRRYLYRTLDIVLYFAHFKLQELYFDPERAAQA